LKDVARLEFIRAASLAELSLGEAVENKLVAAEDGSNELADVTKLLISQKAFKDELSDAIKNIVSIKKTGAADITTRKQPLKRKVVEKVVKGASRSDKTTSFTPNLSIPNAKRQKTDVAKTSTNPAASYNLSAYTFEDADDYESFPASASAMEDVAEAPGAVRKNRRGQRARQQYP
jgi:hypothetical protein